MAATNIGLKNRLKVTHRSFKFFNHSILNVDICFWGKKLRYVNLYISMFGKPFWMRYMSFESALKYLSN